MFIALGGGVAAAAGWGGPPAWWACGMIAGLLLLGLAVRHRRGTLLAAWGTLFCLGGWSTWVRGLPPPVVSCASESLWRVEVDGPVQRDVDDRGVHQHVPVQLLEQQCQDAWQPRAGRVRLRLRPGVPVRRGDVLALRLQFTAVPEPYNPIDPAALTLQRRLNMSAMARVRSSHAVVVPGTGFWPLLDRWREAASAAIEASLSPSTAPLVKALALGDQNAITPAQREAWADAGIAHLLSVSGLHITLIATLLIALSRRVLGWLPGAGETFSLRRWAAAAAVPGALGYCLLAGASPPAVRSAVMAAVAMVGIVLGAPSVAGNAWGLAGCVMLLADPWVIYDIGFVLSFAAVAALLWWTPRVATTVSGVGWRRVLVWVRQGLALSAAASLVTAPITAYVFGRISLAAPLINLFAVPVGSGLATPLALLHAAVSPWWPQAGSVLAVPLQWLLGGLDTMCTWVSELGWVSIDVPTPTPWDLTLAGLLLGGLLMRRLRTARIVTCCAALLIAVTWSGRALAPHGDGRLHLHHVYVGQGDATLVQLPRGGVILVDGGGAVLPGERDPGRLTLAPLLRRFGIRRIDIVVMTHPHPDHINGLVYLTARWPVGELWLTGADSDNPTVRTIVSQVLAHGGQLRRGAENLPDIQREGVDIHVLHPHGPAGDIYPQWHANDNSLVLRLQFGRRSVLLTGDIEARAEAILAAEVPATDILKVAHHGSRTSSTLAFLQRLRPWAAVISCGQDNRFKFPHPDVLARYQALGIDVWRTDRDGMVSWVTNGVTWQLTTARGAVSEYGDGFEYKPKGSGPPIRAGAISPKAFRPSIIRRRPWRLASKYAPESTGARAPQ